MPLTTDVAGVAGCRYLKRFNRHYDAVMKYISQGPMLLDVHMHRPHTTTRNFMDALLAFWPGLQVSPSVRPRPQCLVSCSLLVLRKWIERGAAPS